MLYMLIKLFLEMYHFCRYIFFCSYRPGATDMQLILAQDITQWILASVARIYMVKESGSQQVFFLYKFDIWDKHKGICKT